MILAAKNKVRQEITKLKEQYDEADEELQKTKKELQEKGLLLNV